MMVGKKFSELNQARVAMVGLVVALVIVGLSLNVSRISSLFEAHYRADFERGSGLRSGDPVRVSGVTVGQVRSVQLEGDHVEVSFNVDGIDLGDQTKARVRSDNALGAKFLDVDPAGEGDVDAIPLEQTSGSYDVTAGLSDLTRTEADLDVDQLADSLNALSDTFSGTAPELASAIEGVGRISEVLAARDSELQTLLSSASSLSGVLAERNEDIVQIVSDGNSLLEELSNRRLVIRSLLANARAATTELQGLVADHEDTLGPVLRRIRDFAKVLDRNEETINYVLKHLGPYARSVGESVGGGPFYFAYVANLAATDILPIIPDLIRNEE